MRPMKLREQPRFRLASFVQGFLTYWAVTLGLILLKVNMWVAIVAGIICWFLAEKDHEFRQARKLARDQEAKQKEEADSDTPED